MQLCCNFRVFLLLTATLAAAGTTDYSKIKLPPVVTWYLENFAILRPDKEDRYTGCICPPSLNTTGSTYMFCGHEMSPKAGGSCIPKGAYRCVNGQAEAIMEFDCDPVGAGKSKCGPRLGCCFLKILRADHNAKGCVQA